MSRRIVVPAPALVLPLLLGQLLLGQLLVAGPAAAAGLETSPDQQIADESVLTIGDVPTGFRIFTNDEDDKRQRGSKCKAVNRANKQLNRAPHNETSFIQGRTMLINNQVSVFETPKTAKSAYAAYAGDDAESCFEQSFEASYASQLSESGEVDVTLDRYEPDLGDASVGYEIEIALSDQGEQRTLFVDLELARVGRGVDAFAFLNSDDPFSSDDIVAMTETGVDRLEAAL